MDYAQRIGRSVTIEEVAGRVGISRAQMSKIENARTERIDFDTLAGLCSFYSEALGRPVTTNDVLEFDPNNRERAAILN
nr:helix-turn-helix transcriptional regulator [Oscillochloris sp. ZM17-4]